MPHDLLIRNASVVRDDVASTDVAIAGGKIVGIGTNLGGAAEEIDAAGLHLLPGAIDPHVHFNDPGRSDWEGWETGSNAAAAGGTTCVFDMPLNSSPPTLDGPSFDLKVKAATGRSRVDFGLWGGVTPGDLKRWAALALRGVVGLKAFMSGSGMDDFERADDLTLFRGMAVARRAGIPLAVHAENHDMTAGFAREFAEAGRTDANAFRDSRPPIAELEAVTRAIGLALQVECSLHIVHVSIPEGVRVLRAFKRSRNRLTCETCPHYLLLTAADVERIGPTAKCAPPVRRAEEREGLWKQLAAGEIDFVATDHSPSPPSMKEGPFTAAWGGIAGVQSLLGTMLGEGHLRRGLSLPDVARLTSTAAAERFKIAGKGKIEVGYDADLVLVDLTAGRPLERSDLLDRHKLSPFVGLPVGGFVKRTILRGKTIFLDGRVIGEPAGRLVRPAVKERN